MDLSAALPTFVVTLREGFEAALVVGIVLACLKKAQQPQLSRWVYLGIGGGIVASILLGSFLWQSLKELSSAETIYAPVIKQTLEGVFGIVAISMLSWMLIWMTQQAKSLKGEIEDTIQTALTTSNNVGKSIFILVFIAVLREGFESVLFITAKFQQQFILPAFGALAGFTLAALMGFLIFKFGVKINLGLFFKVMGVFLLLIVDGLVVASLKHFDTAITLLSQINSLSANWCIFVQDSCLLGMEIWDASNFLPDKQLPGILLKSLFGYRDHIYLIQLLAYLGFLILVGTVYFQSLKIKSETKS